MEPLAQADKSVNPRVEQGSLCGSRDSSHGTSLLSMWFLSSSEPRPRADPDTDIVLQMPH